MGMREEGEGGEHSSRISEASDESNKTRIDGNLGQIGRPFNWEFDEFMDFLICYYRRPLGTPFCVFSFVVSSLFFSYRTKHMKTQQYHRRI